MLLLAWLSLHGEDSMPRLILLLVFALLAGWVVWTIGLGRADRARGERGATTYRARRRPWRGWRWPRGRGGEGVVHLVRQEELSGVRDALSSAAIGTGDDLYRCGKCLAFYQRESVVALDADNAGRCVLCGGSDLAPVRVIDD